VNKAKVYGLLIAGILITGFSSPKAQAGIKDNSWVDNNMIKVIENTVSLTTSEIGEATNNIGYWSMSEKSNHYVVPIEVKHPGLVTIIVKVDNLKDGSINCGLYKDIKLTTEIRETKGLSKSKTEVISKYNLKKGTYYFALEKQGAAKGTAVKGVIGAIVIRSDDRTIKTNKSYYGYFDEDNDEIYYKLTVNNDGYIIIKGTSRMILSICDTDKNVVSGTKILSSENNYSAVFALNNGTYYIKLKGDKGEFALGNQFVEVPAVTKEIKTVDVGSKQIFILGPQNKADETYWIKLELKKPTKLKLNTVWMGGYGRVNFSIKYSGDTKVYFNDYYIDNTKTSSVIKLEGDKEWNAGTYYIGVQKDTDLAYSILSIELEKIN